MEVRGLGISCTLMLAVFIAMFLAPSAFAQDVVSGLTVHVYTDGVSLSGKSTFPALNVTIPITADTKLSVKKDSFDEELSVTAEQITPQPMPMSIELYAITSTSPKGPAAGTSTLRMSLQLTHEEYGSLNVKLSDMAVSYNYDTMSTQISGTATVEASGKMQSLMLPLLMVKKENIQKALEEQGIRGIEINKLDIRLVRENAVEVGFDVTMLYTQLMESLKISPEALNVTLMKKLNVPSTYEMRFTLKNASLTMWMKLDVKANINQYWVDYANNIKGLLPVLSRASVPAVPTETPSLPPVSTETIDRVIEELSKFEILPSDAKFHLGIDPSTEKMTVEFTSPKLIKKGADVKETIVAIYDLATKVSRRIWGDEAVQKLNEMNVNVVAEPGIRTLLEGREVTSVKFGNLPALQIEFAPPYAPPTQVPTLEWVTIGIIVAAVIVVAAVTTLMVTRRKRVATT